MQTFADWIDQKLLERGWTAADLTAASHTPEYKRGLDSGLISRWRRHDELAVVPNQAKTLTRLARAFGVPEAEVYLAAGLPTRGTVEARSKVDAMRQSARDELDNWLTVVGPRYEQMFLDDLRNRASSTIALIRGIETAVSDPTDAAISASVRERPKRSRRPKTNGKGPLSAHQYPVSARLERRLLTAGDRRAA